MSHQHNRYLSVILATSMCLIIVGAEVACTGPSTATPELTPVTTVTLSPTPIPLTEPPSGPTEPPPTEPSPGPPELSSTPQPTTAVLFLIDESGGVSGRCPQEPTTDRDGLRYDLVRFYLSLWEAYYSGRGALSEDDERVLGNLPRLYVGVAQFACTYEQIFPLTLASDLVSSAEWRHLYQRLLSPEEMLNGFTHDTCTHNDNRFCATAYTEALTETVNQFPDDASRRILVLLTDGSFQGVIPPSPRDTARSSVQAVLEQLYSQYGIEVHVLLLGEHMCPGSDCPLNNDAMAERNMDLNIWKEWSVSARAAHPEEKTAFEVMGNALADLLPGAHYHDGWLDGGEQTPVSFLGQTQLVRVVMVTSKPSYGGALHLWDENQMGADVEPQYPLPSQWFHGEAEIHPTTFFSVCMPHEWTLELWDDLTAYWWLVTENRQVAIAPPVPSPETIVLNRSQDVTVTVELTNWPWPPQCYQLAVSVGDQEKMLDLDGDSVLVNANFTLPMTLSWGSLPVRAQLVYTDDPEKSPRPEESRVFVRFEPEVGPVIVDPDPIPCLRGYNISMTVPISWTDRIPDFEAHFAFFPEPFLGDDPTYRDGCTIYADVAGAETTADPWVRSKWNVGNIWYYQFAVPYEQVLENNCDYRHLRLRWTGGGIEDTIWTEINRGSLPPIPTPSPSP